MQKAKRIRLDTLLVERGLFSSMEKAKRAIIAGKVTINGIKLTKTGNLVNDDVHIDIAPRKRYVSRGGDKLAGAIKDFSLSINDFIIVDIGASTGGFTDCLLKNGARKVYALDVGYGQLDWSLRNDPRVVVIDRKNARYLELSDLGELMDMATIDVSFISLTKILPPLMGIVKDGGVILALIKPQFEAGPSEVVKGVVKKEEVRQKVVEEIKKCALQLRLEIKGVVKSCLKGPKGNIEFFIYLKK